MASRDAHYDVILTILRFVQAILTKITSWLGRDAHYVILTISCFIQASLTKITSWLGSDAHYNVILTILCFV